MLTALLLAALIGQAGDMLSGLDTSCKVIAVLPATLRDLVRPPEELRRFELRRCGAGNVQVYAYLGAEKQPALAFDTEDPYPIFLAHETSVLVMETAGGSVDHVYVFAFRNGQPIVVLRTATKEHIEVKRDPAHEKVIVEVPPVSYHFVDGSPRPPSKVYTFAIERAPDDGRKR